MGVFIGLDAGATKTVGAAADQSGQVLALHRSGGANLHYQSVVEIQAVFSQILKELKLQLKRQMITAEWEGMVIGIAGMDTEVDREKARQLKQVIQASEPMAEGVSVVIVNDAYIGIRSVTPEETAVALIAGTGSRAYGISGQREVSAGHWGYLLGDQGSGFSLGQAILRTVFSEHDGRREASGMLKFVLDEAKVKAPEDLIPLAYEPVMGISFVASMAKLFKNKEFQNLPEAKKILGEWIDGGLNSYRAVVKRLGLSESNFPVIIMGSVLTKLALGEVLLPRLLQITPGISLMEPVAEPYLGALSLARSHKPVFPESAVF